MAAWLAVTKEIKRSSYLCVRAGGRHERLTLSSSSNDIFITSVLRHRLFNLNQEGKFRMAIAQHRRSIAAPKHGIPYLPILAACRVVWGGWKEGGRKVSGKRDPVS